MKRIILFLIIGLMFFGAVSSSVSAYTLIAREAQGFDEALYVKDQEEYAFPEKILIAQIDGAPRHLSDNADEWIDMLYYHFVTRLEFADLPYNYIFDRKGDVHQGRTGFDGVIPELSTQEGIILIGYLSNGSDITTPAAQSLEELVEDLSYKYGIPRDEVAVVDLTIAEKEEGALSKLDYDVSRSLFAEQVTEKLEEFKYSATDHVNVQVELIDAVAPSNADSGNNFEVKLTIKNSGESPWFTFNDYLYVVTADGEDSEFAVNKEWDSFDVPTHLEGSTIFPGETAELLFNMSAPFFPGDYSEEFGIKRLADTGVIEGTNFAIDFTVDKGDLQLVEILETGSGFLNVRGTPAYGGEQVGQVEVGGIFVMVKQEGQWYLIKYDGEEEGWVFGDYVKSLE